MPHGRQYLLQAADEYEMNEWIAAINFAGAYKTAGICMPFAAPRVVGGAPPRSGSIAETKRSFASDDDTAASSRIEMALLQDGLDVATVEAALQPSRLSEASEVSSPSVAGVSKLEFGLETGETALPKVLPSPVPRKEAIQVREPRVFSCGRNADAEQSLIRAAQIKLADYHNRYMPLMNQIKDELLVVRHLRLLIPFERASKDKIEANLSRLSVKIHQLRMQAMVFKCWIDILEADFKGNQDHART